MAASRILLVDDDKEYSDALVRALAEYSFDTAVCAEEAIEKAKNGTYSLVITDNNMNDGHGNSGLYVIDQIRKFDRDLPILLFSSYVTPDIEREAHRRTANGVFRKSVSLSEMRRVIEQYGC